MRFSIVTISFNQAEFLERCIQSVLNQRGVELDYIVVDPGSTDGSRDIIEKYRDRIAHVVFEPDKGPPDGLNKGFALATGDVLGYLNSDDVLMPGALAKAAKAFNERPELDVVSGHGYVIDENDKVVQKLFSHRFDVRRYAARCCTLLQPSTFFRAGIYRKVGGFNIANHTTWDGELAVEFALAGAKFAVVHDYWSAFRVYPRCITGSVNYMARLAASYREVVGKLGLTECTKLERQYLRYTGWVRQPVTLALRLADGVVHPNRSL